VEPPLAPRILIKVIDQGIGIPQNLLETLFSFTTRTTRIGTKGEQGTGFGMPIVKTLLEKMGGTLEVHSQVLEEGQTSESPHGTTFTLRVPQFAV
jgi:signal transduction histidine kinase